MTLLIINPNSTVAMTEAMVDVARSSLPGQSFEGWTSHNAPPAIQGVEDGLQAAPHLLGLVDQANRQAVGGIMIGCFDDTALAEASQRARCPVVGIGQAAYHFAALQSWRFSVVTTLAVSVPILEENIHTYGLDHLLGRVRASDVPVLELEENPEAAATQVLNEALEAEAKDDIDAVILGCAGMVNVFRRVQQELTVPVIDPVVQATRCLGWLSAS